MNRHKCKFEFLEKICYDNYNAIHANFMYSSFVCGSCGNWKLVKGKRTDV